MKFRKTAAAAAAVLALSLCTVNASAIDIKYCDKGSNNTIYVNADKANDPNWSADYNADITTVYGFTYKLKLDPKGVAEGAWFGGSMIINSNSSGWKPLVEWGGGKEISIDNTQPTAEITYLSSTPLFDKNDKYAQCCMQSWGADVTVTGVELLDKSGKPIDLKLPSAEAAEGEETEAAAEEAKPAETEAAKEEKPAKKEKEKPAKKEEAAPAVDYSSLKGDVISSDKLTSGGAWGQALALDCIKNEGGTFDPAILTEDKAVVVFYKADTAPEVILQSWSGGAGWAKVPANEEYSVPGVAVFTYDYMTAMYEGDNFTETLDKFYVGDTGSELTVTKVILVDVADIEALAASSDEAEEVYEEEEEIEEELELVEEEEEEVEEPAAVVTVPEVAEPTVAEIVVTEAAPAAVTETAPVSTGNTSVAAIAAIMALAGSAAVISKRK